MPSDLDERYSGLIIHTLYLGGIAALITVSVALILAFANRLAPTRAIRTGISLGNVGYALPGSVLAVSIMLAFSYLDRELVVPLSSWLGGAGKPLLLGSLSALVLAYLVRFLAVAYGPLENSLARIRPSLPEAARSLGVSGPRLFCKVYLPLLLPGTLSAALLVFVDVRAVETIDFMTARWAHLPYELLETVSGRIINEIEGISRVTYDVRYTLDGKEGSVRMDRDPGGQIPVDKEGRLVLGQNQQ